MKTRGNSNKKLRVKQRYQPYQSLNRRTCFTNSQFSVWKQRIDTFVYKQIGFHLDDLPDQSYRQWFEDGYLKPKQVGYIILGNYYHLYNLNLLYFNN